MQVLIHTLLRTEVEGSLQLFGVISRFLLTNTLSYSSRYLFSPHSQLCFSTQWDHQTPSGLLLPALCHGNSQQSNRKADLHCFLALMDYSPLSLKKPLFHIFWVLFVCFRCNLQTSSLPSLVCSLVCVDKHIDACNHHHNKDRKHFHPPSNSLCCLEATHLSAASAPGSHWCISFLY